MLGSLNSAVSGLQQFQNKLDVIGNNISNANTTGYKYSRATFQDAFSQTLRDAVPTTDSSTGTGPGAQQIGSGVMTAAIANVFKPGVLSKTDLNSDLGINGEGFFVVHNPASGEEFVTRSGEFTRDTSGYLVNNNGFRVQGFNNALLTQRGDLRIDTTGMPSTSDPNATIDKWGVDTAGQIHVYLSDGTSFIRGQVLLQSFTNPQALVKEGNSLYSGIGEAGPLGGAAPQADVPGTAGLGEILSGRLELSNVDLSGEFANLITTQRAFQANARVVTTSDEVLQEVVNLIR